MFEVNLSGTIDVETATTELVKGLETMTKLNVGPEPQKLVQDIAEMSRHFHQAPYPILSFLHGLYCDAEWSTEAFQKWVSSEDAQGRYQWEGYLDPYPNMPHGARQLITVDVPALPKPPDGRRMATPALAEEIWPHLVNELMVSRASAKAYQGRPSQRARAQLEPTRVFVSSLALIYLENELPSQAQVTSALAADKYAGVGRPADVLAALEVVFNNRLQPSASSKEALQALKAGLVTDFTTAPSVW